MNTHPEGMGSLQVDQDQIERFVSALFRYADEGTFVSLRAFDQFDRTKPPFITKAVAINGSLSPLIGAGALAAQQCAEHHRPIVFAPPIATFSNPDHARGVDLANGLALSAEIDDADPEAARTRLEQILGPVTVAVESGSFWTDPVTGELKPKLHLHWRLSEPTLEPEDHELLRQARKLAALLVGADPTGNPIVHPLRWPGSWNCKAKPRLAQIASFNETAEIHLNDALERLTEAAGLQETGIPRGSSGPPEAPIELVRSAMQAIPNPGIDVHYDDWIKLGYAAYRATGGSEDGFAIWDEWSRKSEKYNVSETQAAWLRIKHAIEGSNAPCTVGAGTIFFHAGKAGWQRPKAEQQDHDKANNSGAKTHADGAGTEAGELPPAFFDPWADPSPPEFPGGVLSRRMEDTIFALALRDGVCAGALAMAYLAATSGAACKATRFAPYQNSTWSVPPIIWVMAIADSGQRKTAIEDLAFAALRKAHAEHWRAHKERLRVWQALPGKERRETPKPEEPHSYIVEDVTPEKLQMILAATDRGTFMARDEMAGLLEFGRYGGNSGAAERAFYLQAYEGGHYTVSRVSRDSLHITVNGLTIYGCIQPDRLQDFPDLAKDGLLQRMNMIRAGTATSSRDDMVVQGTGAIDAAIVALNSREGQHYKTTPEGSDLIRHTERDGRNFATIADFGAGFQGTCSKLHGTHARYGLILHLLDDPDCLTIPTATIERASLLVRQFLLPQARAFFSALAGSAAQRLRDVAGWVLAKAPMRIRAADLTAGVYSCRGMGTKELGELLDPLVTGGWLEPETPFPNNRAWTVVPMVRTAFAERAEAERARRAEVRAMLAGIGGTPLP